MTSDCIPDLCGAIYRDSPLNMGLTFHTPRQPSEVNWPKESSKKNSGMPQNTSMIKYGNMKAPDKYKNTSDIKSFI